ncbi:MAG: tetratricopeptide repeat protein [SAR324 cluster bacterium]|nr:tetratricopeptide repeat protein [SAR324 cluster bacterium]
MRIKIWILTGLLSLWWVGQTVLAQDAVTSIQGIELKRLGQQLNVRFLCDMTPVYEIVENLDRQTMIIKFKNARTAFPDGKDERRFNDVILEGIRFMPVGKEIWAQIKTLESNLAYSIGKSQQPGVLELELRPSVVLNPLPPPPREPSLRLTAIRFGMHPPDYSRATFTLSGEARIMIVQDKDQKTTKIRFADTHPAPDLKIPTYSDDRIRFVEITKDPNQTFISIESTTGKLEVKESFLYDPPRWVVDFYGEPGSAQVTPEVAEVVEEKKDLTEEEQQKLAAEEKKRELAEKEKRKEDRARSNRQAALRNNYAKAESAFRDGSYTGSINIFRQIYTQAKADTGEFKDPLDPLAIQSLFRIADAIYTMVEKENGRNYHEAITAYETAIRVAKQNDVELDLIPHAYFRIGQSYHKMQFYDDANLIYQQIETNYPGSVYATEARFWKAVSQVDRREWNLAIQDFREYLRTPDTKHLATAYYKMAEAYYNINQYIKAREAFDKARAIDPRYPDDASLLFRMGETYYETADYATAREVFKVLLKRYPDADFSKLVALRLGDFLRDEGQEDEAIAVYQTAMKSFSRDIALLGKMRIANIQAQRPYSREFHEAIKVYDEIVTKYPESSQVENAMLRKGLTLTLFGQYVDAIAALETYMQKYPNSVYVNKNIIQDNIDENLKGLINRHFMEGDYLGVLAIYQEYKAKYLTNFQFDTTLFQVGIAYQKIGLFDDALDLFNFVENRTSQTLKELTAQEKAEVLIQKGELALGRDTLARFINAFPDSPYDADVRKRLAEVFELNRQYPEAIQVYEETLRKYVKTNNPLHAEIVPNLYFQLAELNKNQGNYVRAEESYIQTIKQFRHPVIGDNVPGYIIQSHFYEAEMAYKRKNLDTALQKYEKAISLYSGRDEPEVIESVRWARFYMGNIFQSTGELQKGLAIYKELMDIPDNPDALWKKLAKENFDALTRQLAYENYLKN